MAEYSVVGKRLPRVDALSKVTGTAVYSGDVALPGMLHGKILRSPLAHARIVRLDTAAALALDGVRSVITAADVPAYQHKSSLLLQHLPYLAREKVVYVGQPVAVVAAVSVPVAEAALRLIEVAYEELPPVLDMGASLDAATPPIHDGLYTNIITSPEPGKDDKPSNTAYHLIIKKGDVAAGFGQADIVIENTFNTATVHQGYIEPFASLAAIDISGKITVWTQSQGIFEVRQLVAEYLELPLNRIRVVPVEIGGAFGGKTYLPLAPLCALLAMRTGQPVRMEMTRDEVIADSRPAPASQIKVKLGVTRQGQITAAAVDLVFDCGAFPEASHAMFTHSNLLSQYRIPNVLIDARDVLTNRVPTAMYRAPSMPQSSFAVESQMDIIAEVLGMDPMEFRLQNVAREGDIMPNGQTLPKVGFRETLEAMARYLREKGDIKGEHRGRGIACGFWAGASGGFGAYVHVNADGSVYLVVGVTDISGSRTPIAQIVAEELCLPYERVTVVNGDTETSPWATMSVGSMTVYSLSTAAYLACQDVKAQLGAIAAGKLGVEPDAVEFSGGVFRVKNEPENAISWDDLARSTVGFGGEGPVVGRGSVGSLPMAPTLSVHAADVEVDAATGRVKVVSYAAAQDVGLAINPMAVEGQIQGGVVQGIGWALMEGYVYRNGEVQNTNLLDYRLPTATDVPNIDTILVEVGSAAGTYGLRHAAEPPIIPTVAAIANAIYGATGVRLKELPISPEAVFLGLSGQGRSGQ